MIVDIIFEPKELIRFGFRSKCPQAATACHLQQLKVFAATLMSVMQWLQDISILSAFAGQGRKQLHICRQQDIMSLQG